MNKVILIGRLTRDPEIRYTQAAEPMAVAKYALAVDRRSKKEGQPTADFINCVAFGRNAEFAERWFKKGMMVSICGRLQVSTYEKNGQRQYYTDVLIEEQNFAESKASFESRRGGGLPEDVAWHGATQGEAPQKSQPSPGGDDFFAIDQNLDEDDLPF